MLRAYFEPKLAAPPLGYRIGPLWYVALAFHHNKLAGGLRAWAGVDIGLGV